MSGAMDGWMDVENAPPTTNATNHHQDEKLLICHRNERKKVKLLLRFCIFPSINRELGTSEQTGAASMSGSPGAVETSHSAPG